MVETIYHYGFLVCFAEFRWNYERLVAKKWANKRFEIIRVENKRVFMKRVLKDGCLSITEVSMKKKQFEQKVTILKTNIVEINDEDGEIDWECRLHGDVWICGCDPCGTLHCGECGELAKAEDKYHLCRNCELQEEWEEEQDKLIAFEERNKQEEFEEFENFSCRFGEREGNGY